jgi:uncharacterized protein
MHRSFGQGSVSNEATAYGRANGITVIDGGCPLMYEPAADGFHKVMRLAFTRAVDISSASELTYDRTAKDS